MALNTPKRRILAGNTLFITDFNTLSNIQAEMYRRCMNRGIIVVSGSELNVYKNRKCVAFPLAMVSGTGQVLASAEFSLNKQKRNHNIRCQVYMEAQVPWVRVQGSEEISKGVAFFEAVKDGKISNSPSMDGSQTDQEWEHYYYNPDVLRRSNAGVMEVKKGAVVKQNRLTYGEIR